jgi:hypothetical protein
VSDHIDPSKLEGDMIPQGRYKPARELKELHENTDLDVKGVLVNTFVLMALCVVTFIAVKFVMDYFVGVETTMNEARLGMRFPDAPPPPQPNLQADPARETTDEILKARGRLESYGWVDREKKTAHIPIERAIAILAEKGLPKGGKMDEFHPRQGSSNPVKIGEPAKAGDAAKPAEPAPAGEPAKPVAKDEPAPDAGSQP